MPYIKGIENRKFLNKLVDIFISNQDDKVIKEWKLEDIVINFRKHFSFVGNLNYFLFKLAKSNDKLECFGNTISYTYFKYFIKIFMLNSCHCYADFQSFIGELTCAKFEIERRLYKNDTIAFYLDKVIKYCYKDIIAPYEDKKIKENGDVE